jgi:hypothetical protein
VKGRKSPPARPLKTVIVATDIETGRKELHHDGSLSFSNLTPGNLERHGYALASKKVYGKKEIAYYALRESGGHGKTRKFKRGRA